MTLKHHYSTSTRGMMKWKAALGMLLIVTTCALYLGLSNRSSGVHHALDSTHQATSSSTHQAAPSKPWIREATPSTPQVQAPPTKPWSPEYLNMTLEYELCGKLPFSCDEYEVLKAPRVPSPACNRTAVNELSVLPSNRGTVLRITHVVRLAADGFTTQFVLQMHRE